MDETECYFEAINSLTIASRYFYKSSSFFMILLVSNFLLSEIPKIITYFALVISCYNFLHGYSKKHLEQFEK